MPRFQIPPKLWVSGLRVVGDGAGDSGEGAFHDFSKTVFLILSLGKSVQASDRRSLSLLGMSLYQRLCE